MFEAIRKQHFPAQLTSEISVQSVDRERIGWVWQALAPKIFTPLTDLGHFELPPERKARAAALQRIDAQHHSEHFVFYNAAEEPIGWSTGDMQDAHTYFMTWSGILPSYQNQGIYSAFLNSLMPYLSAIGYERVASKHMVNNRRILVAKLKAGFHITGVELDERWGAQVTMVTYFHADRYQGFCNAFSLEPFAQAPSYLVEGVD